MTYSQLADSIFPCLTIIEGLTAGAVHMDVNKLTGCAGRLDFRPASMVQSVAVISRAPTASSEGMPVISKTEKRQGSMPT